MLLKRVLLAPLGHALCSFSYVASAKVTVSRREEVEDGGTYTCPCHLHYPAEFPLQPRHARIMVPIVKMNKEQREVQ